MTNREYARENGELKAQNELLKINLKRALAEMVKAMTELAEIRKVTK